MCAHKIIKQIDDLILFVEDNRFNPFEVSRALEYALQGGKVMIDEKNRSITLVDHSNDNTMFFPIAN